MTVIDTVTNTVIATIPVGGEPHGVAVSPDGSKVYVTNRGSNNVSVISAATNTVVATIGGVGSAPEGVAVSPDGSKVYVANFFSNTVSVIATPTNTVTDTIAVGIEPLGVAATPDGSKVYVANEESFSVSVISTATNTVTNTIPITSGPGIAIEGVAVSPDGSKVYVTNEGDSPVPVSVIDTTTNTVIATILISSGDIAGTFGVAATPDGSKVYITNAFTNTVSVIDTTTNTVVATIGGVGSAPEGVAVSPDGSKVYVANFFSNTVSVIATPTNTVIATIAVGSNPVAFGIFIQPAPAGILQVFPTSNIAASGTQGEAFSPASFQYQLTSTIGSVNYLISGIPTWLNASFTSGTATTSPVTVTFSLINPGSRNPGNYTATIAFTNTSNGQGNTTRTATLIVNAGTKDGCKDEGWKNYISFPGPFMNQGQCVSYFARQP